MKRYCYIWLLVLCFCWSTAIVRGQGRGDLKIVRYVIEAAHGGDNNNDGLSWISAKSDLQEAINDLKQYMDFNYLDSGCIYVGEGTYRPTESTESEGGGLQYTAFKIYPGIHIYGGYDTATCAALHRADQAASRAFTATPPYDNDGSVNTTYRPMNTLTPVAGRAETLPWSFSHPTTLSGSHLTEPRFTYDAEKGVYNTLYSGNSYHVVWFATNGFIPLSAGLEKEEPNHALPLPYPASLDGCRITGGYAANKTTTSRYHTSYGGGVYLVKGASISRCIVDYCTAMLRGGGIYMDGGGSADLCYVNTCQATGVGIMQGLGGGVCIDYDGSITRSYIVNNSARGGGGLAIYRDTLEYPWQSLDLELETPVGLVDAYQPFAAACVVNNNSSSAEGAGVYLYQGGSVNHLTVVHNLCKGTDVTYYGRRHGRTGGLYILNCGLVFNSLLWGNDCPANSHIQYAAHTSGSNETNRPQIEYTGLESHDITDWTGTYKNNVFSLEATNTDVSGNGALYPYFIGHDNNCTIPDSIGAGLKGLAVSGYYNDSIPRAAYWHPSSISSIVERAVDVSDPITTLNPSIRHTNVTTDMFGSVFQPLSSLGALVRTRQLFDVAMVKNIEREHYEATHNADTSQYLPTIFVNPNATPGKPGKSGGSLSADDILGVSWDKPIRLIQDAVYFIKEHYHAKGAHARTYEFNGKYYPAVQVCVMGNSTSTTAGMGAYIGNGLRTGGITPTPKMRIYGGFDPNNSTGTNIEDRVPFEYRTIINGNISGSDYWNNASHIFALINVDSVVIDGIQIHKGNANLDPDVQYDTVPINRGAGIFITNGRTAKEDRIDMIANVLRNAVIANCAAPEGAAVFVNGNEVKANGDTCKAQIAIVNCVIRNCTAGDLFDDHNAFVDPDENTRSKRFSLEGIVTAHGAGAHVHMRNCDVVNNCGFPFKCTPIDVAPVSKAVQEGAGRIQVYNTLIFSNGLRVRANRGGIENTVFCTRESFYNVTGKYIYMGYDVLLPVDWGECTYPATDENQEKNLKAQHVFRVLTHFKSEDRDTLHHRVNNGSQQGKWGYLYKNHANPDSAKLYEITKDVVYYPTFSNPARNVGHSEGDDLSYYGGGVTYSPLPTNPIVNAANPHMVSGSGIVTAETTVEDKEGTIAYDFSMNTRDYGGDPDIGAIECTDLPRRGAVIYVTPEGAGRMDGSSWGNAIAGNAVYAMDDAPAAGSDEKDATSHRLHDSSGNSILTTDERYCGGFAQSYFTSKTTGGTSTTTVRKTWTTETNVYDNGARQGDTEPLQDHVERETILSTLTPGSSEPGFVAGWDDDDRFPYGEISGQSRGFWRATGNSCPVDENGNWVSGYTGAKTRDGVVNVDSIAKATATGQPIALVVTNERRENYVSGLQYAVEQASMRNKTYHVDSVQVWVGAGKYTDYKGFIMRDSVTVLGGFPAGKYGTPSSTERRALLSAVVSIPKSIENKALDAADYETILQVSDINPRTDYKTFNSNAIFFGDNDLAVNSVTDTRNYEYLNVNIVHHYRDTTIVTRGTELTTSYIQYADMTGSAPKATIAGSDVTRDEAIGGVHYKNFGTRNGNLDCWHLSYPEKTNYVANIENDAKTNNAKKTIYNPETQTALASSEYTNRNWIMIGNGSLTGLTLWQDLTDVPAGDYQISVDIAGGYRNAWKSKDTTMIFFRVYDASGTKCAEVNIKTRGSYANKDDGPNNREMAYRHVLTFNQPTTGPMRIAVEIEDGVRNTKTANPTYGTDDGGDPDPIPDSYASSYGGSNPNRREFWISNLHLYPVVVTTGYDLVRTDSTAVDNTSVPHQPSEVTSTTRYSVSKSRTTLRKRVLQMPDICNPMFAYPLGGDASGKGVKYKLENSIEHVERIDKPTRKSRGSGQIAVNDPNYKEYNEVYWDGFTIRHGFLFDQTSVHAGGAGVSMYEGSHLLNCIITDNIAVAAKQKGGGFFCDGSNSTVEGCFILNNSTAQTKTAGVTLDQTQLFAGGMFLYNGTCFNSLIANNYAHGFGGGLGLCVGNFYNNTVAYNVGGMEIPLAGSNRAEDVGKTVGGVRIATGSTPAILMANTILYGNSGLAVDITAGGTVTPAPFMNCYVHSMDSITRPEFLHAINPHTIGGDKNYGYGNIFLNKADTLVSNTPFAADIVKGVYTGGAKKNNNFALRAADNISCINNGTQDFEGVMETCLGYPGHGISSANQTAFRQMVDGVKLPETDVVFADRVQDCEVDMGAYEYDGTREIVPSYEYISFDPTQPDKRELCAVYYLAEEGLGLATANSPENTACAEKAQKVFDAAGRYSADLATIQSGTPLTKDNRFSTENVNFKDSVKAKYERLVDGKWKKELWPDSLSIDSVKHVVIKLASGTFTPNRTSNIDQLLGLTEDIILSHSAVIPHGVELWGGYLSKDTITDFAEYYRDVPNNKTILSGEVTNDKGVKGNAYHVVSFTNTVFSINDTVLSTDGLSHVDRRAVVDGCLIRDGYANGVDEVDRDGAGAIVPDYGHIRNCTMEDNVAVANGGALYLKPGAITSGCVIVNNEAAQGAGIYVEEPAESVLDELKNDAAKRDSAYSRIYNSTIVRNSASNHGGGLYFGTNIRAKGVVMWQNRANDYNNVSGIYDSETQQVEANYPFSYCAVQSQRLPGVNNIAVRAEADMGVLWTRLDTADLRWRGDKTSYTDSTDKDAHYYVQRISSLVRSGMPYKLYSDLQQKYPTLEYRDMAGVARAQEIYGGTKEDSATYLRSLVLEPAKKKNDFLEIGARAINEEINLATARPFTRLFVAAVDKINVDKASLLLACDDPLYKQQGSSMANPFLKFSDAIDYIVEQRKRTDCPADTAVTWGEIFSNTRFEIFVASGTYYPFHNTQGEEGHARSSTFVLPEAVSIYGGMCPDSFYCQAGYDFVRNQRMAGKTRLNRVAGTAEVDSVNNNDRDTFFTADGRHLYPSIPLDGDKRDTIRLLPATSTDDILERRERADVNGNGVFEPWEFDHNTNFNGETPRGQGNEDNVYHVFTALADTNIVGQLPSRYTTYTGTPYKEFAGELDDDQDIEAKKTEHQISILNRVIIFDGITISNGNARDFDSTAIFNTRHFYRGGGIMVDGSWKDASLNSYEVYDSDSNIVSPVPGYVYGPDSAGLRNIPIIIARCEFDNNHAVQGGAIFSNGEMQVVGSNFTRNLAQGPTRHVTRSDEHTERYEQIERDTIEYVGGGAIASTHIFRCVNTIFANNEAMLGDYDNRILSTAEGVRQQAFGGAVWGGKYSNLRFLNCDFVSNQAVSYPAVYVMERDSVGGQDKRIYTHRFAANTIFWNQVSKVDKTSEFYKRGIIDTLDINRDVFAYRKNWEKNIELRLDSLRDTVRNHIDDKYIGRTWSSFSEDSTALAKYEERQIMFFCSYRNTFGPIPILSGDSVHINQNVKINGVSVPLNKKYATQEVPFFSEDELYYPIFKGNNNINITFVNEGVNGPNFVLPTLEGGIEGYNPAANWMPARINNLTDNGWSYLTIKEDTVGDGGVYFDSIAHQAVETQAPNNIVSGGPYPVYSYQMRQIYGLHIMPYGDEYYMKLRNSSLSEDQTKLLRISSNPLTYDSARAFIDIGVYEYQHRALKIPQNSEVDVLWVATTEGADGNDGHSWETPTSNLQAAIETLLKSRNNHAKQVNIIKGEYSPTAVLGDDQDLSLSFTIQTRVFNNGAFTPRTEQEYAVQGLTIKGGYSDEIEGEGGYDHDQNPVVLTLNQFGNVTSDQVNHIFNILDVEQYSTTMTSGGERTNVAQGTAIPVTFEGLTFKNTEANPVDGSVNKGGAAIYYRQQKQWKDEGETPRKTNTLLRPPARVKEVTEKGKDPKWEWNWRPDTLPNYDSIPKLTIRNCIFMYNGNDTVTVNQSPAIKIEGGGGKTRIVNTLFHHNTGNPIEGVNVEMINCTSGLNGGHIKLEEEPEDYTDDGVNNARTYQTEFHNNIVWLDDQNSATPSTPVSTEHPGTQFDLPATVVTLAVADTTASDHMTYNAITGFSVTDKDAWENIGLSNVNHNVFQGPNFVDPENGDFHLGPGLQVMDTGSDSTYASYVWENYMPAERDSVLSAGPPQVKAKAYRYLMTNTHIDQTKIVTDSTFVREEREDEPGTYDQDWVYYDHLLAPMDYELSSSERLKFEHIDRGAYECASRGQRVIYVDPTLTPMEGMAETGRNWKEAYRSGHLQTAIDAAAVYIHYARAGGAKDPSKDRAYVFVRGAETKQDAIVVQDGVDMYGSLSSKIMANPIDKETAGVYEYTNAEIRAFINRVKATREGMVSELNTPTVIRGISTLDKTDTLGIVIDGFQITDTTKLHKPLVSITAPAVTLRNCIITGNRVVDTCVVYLGDSALLYNTLLYNDSTQVSAPGKPQQPVIKMGNKGAVLNCTLVELDGQKGINEDKHDDDHVLNTIVAKHNDNTFAPYFRDNTNAYNDFMPSFLRRYIPYNYQLHEYSSDIDGGTDDYVKIKQKPGATPAEKAAALKDGDNPIAKKFPFSVDFSFDRDLLGNPRRLCDTVDNGCFETWRVKGDWGCNDTTNTKSAMDIADKYVVDSLPESEGYDDYMAAHPNAIPYAEYWNQNYGGHKYPHRGSVVYVMENAKLVFELDDEDNPLFSQTRSNIIYPGFVLVKKGGAIYGQGNTLRFQYVAMEREYKNQRYALMALPFDYNTAAAITTEYDNEDGKNQLVQKLFNQPFTGYTYRGDLRAAYQYQFQPENSTLWDTIASPSRKANDGWLLSLGDEFEAKDTIVRFTGFAKDEKSFVYTEEGPYKEITLHQYDHRQTAGGLNFTRLEDMGWNFIGAPYLVSNYQLALDPTNDHYNMDIPHVFYREAGNTDFQENCGQVTPSQSWAGDASSTISPGEGFLLQTASIDTVLGELLTFHVPIYEGALPMLRAPRPIVLLRGLDGDGDILRVEPDEEATSLRYMWGRDGIKWISNDMPQLYMLAAGNSRLSLVGSAPVETDLPLGVYNPSTEAQLYTFSLPEPEAYTDYGHVWLIDRGRNRVTNIMKEAYTTSVDPGTNHSRFYLRIGGVPFGDAAKREYIVYAYDRQLFIRGLIEGDRISVYSITGQLVISTTATDAEFTTELPQAGGIYAVRVNDFATKVRNM